MTTLISEDGYAYVTLKKEGIRKKTFIHRALAKQFIPNPDNKMEVDHIDRDKTNNDLSNLRWATRKENQNNKNVTGSIYADNRKDGSQYWKARYSITTGDVKQKTSVSKEVCEQWLINIKLLHPR